LFKIKIMVIDAGTVYYMYPMKRKMSFSYIAENHVEMLREKFNVEAIHLTAFASIVNYRRFRGYIHPFFYPLTTNGEIKDAVLKRRSDMIDTLIGVDVADSNHMSRWAVDMANYATAFIVNSKWSYDAYVQSGIKVPVHVVPHGLETEWFRDRQRPVHPVIRFIEEVKRKQGLFVILYFLWHSGWRKGADLAFKLMECVERNHINYVLVVKKMDITDPGLRLFSRFRTFIVEGELPRDWLIDLYDVADLLLLPSRGGSFEMSGLEALGRGIPVLMPNVGPWTEYTPPGLESYLWVKTAKMVTVLPGNEIHDGVGAEWDPDDACSKFMNIYSNYSEVKARVMDGVKWIRENYSWEAIKPRLWSIHQRYF
jgi:glycosyltransferase involved in cell wall biosynthesis